jgi:hypothetical protein
MHLSVLLMVCGWAWTALSIGSIAVQDETGIHLSFVQTVIGIAAAFTGLLIGMVTLVLNPAIESKVMRHAADPLAHPDLIRMLSYQEKHAILEAAIAELHADAREDRARQGRERSDRQDERSDARDKARDLKDARRDVKDADRDIKDIVREGHV